MKGQGGVLSRVMGFDAENRRFTPANHEMLPAQVAPQVGDMQTGDIFYVDEDAVIVDAGRCTWIAKAFDALDSNRLIQVGYANPSTGFIRVICTHDGLVADQSHNEDRDWQSWEKKEKRLQADLVASEPGRYLPVVHRISNSDELSLVEPILAEEYNIVLDGTELRPLLDYVDRILREDDDERLIAEEEDEDQA